MTFWILLALASGVLGILCPWLIWMTWRQERFRLEGIFILNITRKIHTSEDVQSKLPAMAKYAAKTMPWIQRTLIEEVARKHDKTPEALEKILLEVTGARSLDEALRAPMGSSSVFDMLWATTDTTNNPVQAGIRNWIQTRQLPIPRIHQMENILLAIAIVITVSALVFVVANLMGKFL